MAIIKYKAVHTSPKKFLSYIMNEAKTNGSELVTGLNCTANVDYAFNQMALVFENCSKERFDKKLNNDGKEKIRLHHYIQSFKPEEVTPEQAHKIGIEWAEKVFGRKHQVLVTTHVDRNHIHNHFAVAAYNLSGQKWYGNKTTLKRCRDISDKICKSKGLSVIENPTYHADQKYSDWLARQQNVSWKQRLCDDIDRLILSDNVRSIEDLIDQLKRKNYIVTYKKYLSIRADKNRKAIRSYRLGDGYAIEELQYRIANKNREMSLSKIAEYQGIQREYALCLRELQIMVYRKSNSPYKATFSELSKSAELLTFMCDNKIQSIADFENAVNAAAEQAEIAKRSREELMQKIDEREDIIKNGARFIELNSIEMPTGKQMDELMKIRNLAKFHLRTEEDIERYRQELNELKSELPQIDKSLENAETARLEAANNYKTYLRQMQSDYTFILEKMRREQEEIKQAERNLIKEKERERTDKTYRTYCR